MEKKAKRCPKCGEEGYYVKDGYKVKYGYKRKRICSKCSFETNTIEVDAEKFEKIWNKYVKIKQIIEE